MSRKHYRMMADELRSTQGLILHLARTEPGFVGISQAKGADTLATILHDYTRAVARVFAYDNPRFNYDRFIAACGFGD